MEVDAGEGKVLELRWRSDLASTRAVERRHLGKQVVVTSRRNWESSPIVRTYRRLTGIERLFRSTEFRPAVWCPLSQLTDSKVRVHAL